MSLLADRSGGRNRHRAWLIARTALDWATLFLALLLAYWLRFDWRLSPFSLEQVLWFGPLVVAFQYAMLVRFRVPRFNWSLFSLPEVSFIAWALAVAAAVLLTIRYGLAPLAAQHEALRILLLPSSIILIDGVMAFVALAGLRALRRLQRERNDLIGHRGGNSATQPAIVIGAGRAGHLLAKELRQRPDLGIAPVAFVDDNGDLRGQIIHGIPVLGGTLELREVARQRKASLALIAIASANRNAMRHIISICDEAGLQTKIVPPLHDVISGRVAISQIRDVAIEDLLGREPIGFADGTASAVVCGKVVMVTGAGGSIGSELCRQILGHQPARLVLVERAENNLFNIHRELSVEKGGDLVVPAIGDVTDEARLTALFEKHRPQVVFHAAAHKHVPMMEINPSEAVKNNFLGTRLLADLSDRFRVEDFVLISTDKAVNPTSVMGATKRLAELYIQDLQKRSSSRFSAVRFGNVLGSSGSVIPLFREQIARGGPVCVTHPEMTRYFMTIPEACRLVIRAAGLGEGGAVMVLDMGEPVRILDLAEQMIRLSGLEPGLDIEIRYTGVRPGEKLFEELALDTELVDATRASKVFVWRSQAAPAVSLVEIVRYFEGMQDASRSSVRRALQRFLPEYTPLKVHDRAEASTRARTGGSARVLLNKGPGGLNLSGSDPDKRVGALVPVRQGGGAHHGLNSSGPPVPQEWRRSRDNGRAGDHMGRLEDRGNDLSP